MGLEQFRRFLRSHERAALDSSLFIYHLQQHAKYSVFTNLLFRWMEEGTGNGVATTLAMTEVLVKPNLESNEKLTGEAFTLLKGYPNLEWVPVDLNIATLAARHRAVYRLRTPDAMLSATAVLASADSIITNDHAFKRVDVVDVAVLDDLL